MAVSQLARLLAFVTTASALVGDGGEDRWDEIGPVEDHARDGARWAVSRQWVRGNTYLINSDGPFPMTGNPKERREKALQKEEKLGTIGGVEVVRKMWDDKQMKVKNDLMDGLIVDLDAIYHNLSELKLDSKFQGRHDTRMNLQAYQVLSTKLRDRFHEDIIKVPKLWRQHKKLWKKLKSVKKGFDHYFKSMWKILGKDPEYTKRKATQDMRKAFKSSKKKMKRISLIRYCIKNASNLKQEKCKKEHPHIIKSAHEVKNENQQRRKKELKKQSPKHGKAQNTR